ncbi:signal peptidase I, partial [Patescibacteria group bacterium]
QPFYVKGASMEPNFYDREYLVIDEISYRFHPPSRGDIIVFRPPGQAGQYFIKRVIGLPGETVTIAKGAIYVSANAKSKGTKLDESSYLPLIYTPGELQVTLKADEFFILGDNRASSLDSRAFGPLPKSNIVGRVWIRGWPLEKAGTIAVPSYPVGG